MKQVTIKNIGATADLTFYAFEIRLEYIEATIKRKGYATELMRRICAFADVKKLDVSLLPVANSGMKLELLRKWYASFGFKDYESGMIRENIRE